MGRKPNSPTDYPKYYGSVKWPGMLWRVMKLGGEVTYDPPYWDESAFNGEQEIEENISMFRVDETGKRL